MSKKQAIILFLSAILVGFLAIQPFNYVCRISGLCNPIIISYYFAKKPGNLSFDVIFEAKNLSSNLKASSLTRSDLIYINQNFEAKYEIRNSQNYDVKIRPKRYIFPVEAKKYIKFYECLCGYEYKIKKKSSKEVSVKFYIDPKIEEDEFFKNNPKIIRIGYEF